MLLANSLRKSLELKSHGESEAERNLQILNLLDDDKRNTTESAFSIQNIVEVGLHEHGRLPGEWYGVSKMNEIFKVLNDTYNFDTKLSGNILGNFKICEFKNGEIISKEILKEGLGPKEFNLLVEQKIIMANDGG